MVLNQAAFCKGFIINYLFWKKMESCWNLRKFQIAWEVEKVGSLGKFKRHGVKIFVFLIPSNFFEYLLCLGLKELQRRL